MTHSTLSRTFFSFFSFFFENEVCHTHTHETTDNIWLALLDKESIYIYIYIYIFNNWIFEKDEIFKS